jgi:hypothetical protein
MNKEDLKFVKLPDTPEMHELGKQMYAARNKTEREIVFTKMQNYFDRIGFPGDEDSLEVAND